MRNARLNAYKMAVAVLGVAIGLTLKKIWPGLSKTEVMLYGVLILVILVVLIPMHFKNLRAPKED